MFEFRILEFLNFEFFYFNFFISNFFISIFFISNFLFPIFLYYDFFSLLWKLGSLLWKIDTCNLKTIAHWVRNYHSLKNKCELTLCQSRLHTASETFVRHKKNYIEFFASVVSVFRCFDNSEPPYKRIPKSRMAIVKFIHFISQHTEFTETGGLLFNMWLQYR